jgi:hypothetical protein
MAGERERGSKWYDELKENLLTMSSVSNSATFAATGYRAAS